MKNLSAYGRDNQAGLPTPFSSSSTAGMDTVRKTALAGGIKAGRVFLTARLKLSGMVGSGRDSPNSSACSLCRHQEERLPAKRGGRVGFFPE